MYTQLLDMLNAKKRPRILVLGDWILDEYITGEVARISPEAPIPIIRRGIDKREFRLGGAANVAAGVAALGGDVTLAGVIGADLAGANFLKLLRRRGIEKVLALQDPKRPTTQKLRFISGGHQMLRSDLENAEPISSALENRLSAKLDGILSKQDAVILSDYRKGLLTPYLCGRLFASAKKNKVPVLVDPKGRDYRIYKGAAVITPNLKEAEEATGQDVSTEAGIEKAGRALLKITGAEAAVITRSGAGLSVFSRGGRKPLHVKAEARSVYDVTGAGDTFIATLGFCAGLGYPVQDGVRLANLAAGLAVERFGTAVIRAADLEQALLGHGPSESKIKKPAELAGVLRERQKRGEKIVFTNGCFDILHLGHVRYLHFARHQGRCLVVGLNTDSSIRMIKGPKRPIVSEMERARILASLEDVDYVVLFSEETPLKLVRQLQPDVIVKGEDYAGKTVVGRDVVEARGGRVVLAPFLKGASTTNIIGKILDAEGAGSNQSRKKK